MIAQNFKGDPLELKMQAVAAPVLGMTGIALDDLYAGGFDSTPFLLMLYDQSRITFSERIPRDAFVAFILQTLLNFPFIGTFEIYLFILRAIFGADTEILFDVDTPGILIIDVLAIAGTEFQFIGREFVDDAYTFFDMIDSNGDLLKFRGVPGIETEYDLNLLFSEIVPAGIIPHISLTFFSKYDFIAYEGSNIYNMTDSLGNQIIFTEMGG